MITNSRVNRWPPRASTAPRIRFNRAAPRTFLLSGRSPVTAKSLDEFIDDWKKSSAAERANYGLFLTQLCDQLGVPQPQPTQADVTQNAYVFERDVKFDQGDGTITTGRIDLDKRGCFILEPKQGSDAIRAEDEAAESLAAKGATAAKKKGTAVRGRSLRQAPPRQRSRLGLSRHPRGRESLAVGGDCLRGVLLRQRFPTPVVRQHLARHRNPRRPLLPGPRPQVAREIRPRLTGVGNLWLGLSRHPRGSGIFGGWRGLFARSFVAPKIPDPG